MDWRGAGFGQAVEKSPHGGVQHRLLGGSAVLHFIAVPAAFRRARTNVDRQTIAAGRGGGELMDVNPC
jgi:hypothetical protein